MDLKFYLYERLFEKAELNLISNNRATKVEDVEDDGRRPVIFTSYGLQLLVPVMGVATLNGLQW